MKLDIYMLFRDNPYSPTGIGWTVMREIYLNYLPRFGHNINWIFSCKEEEMEYLSEMAHAYPVPYFFSRSLPGRVFNRILQAYRIAKIATRIISRQGPSIIQANWDLIDGLVALYVARRRKAPFVLLWDEPLEMAYESRKLETGKHSYLHYLMLKLGNPLLRYIMRKADLILMSELKKREWVNRGIEESKITAIHGVNVDLFSPDKVEGDIRREYGLGDSKVILYTGTMARIRRLDMLIRNFSKIREAKRNAKLLMVGDGTGKADLERLADELGVKRDIVFTGLVPYLDVPDFIAASDIAVSAVPPLDLYRASSPSKLVEYMAMAKPVVANEEIAAHREAIEQSGGGMLVPFSEEAFASAIIELLDNPEKALEMGRRGRQWVLKNRSYEVLARRLERRYFQLLRKSGR